MKKTFKKVMAMVLTLAMVVSGITVYHTTAKADDAPEEHTNFELDSVVWEVLTVHGGNVDNTYYISEGNNLGNFYWGIYVEHGTNLPYHDQRSNCIIGDDTTIFSVCENNVTGLWVNSTYYDNHTEEFNRDGDCVEIAVSVFTEEYNVVTLVYSGDTTKTFGIRVEEPLEADATEPRDQEYIDPESIEGWTQISNTTTRGSNVYVSTEMIDDGMFGTRNLWGLYATASASPHYNIDDSYGIWDVPVLAMTSSGNASAVIVDGLDYINASDPTDKLVCVASDCVYIAQELFDDAYIGEDTYHTITFEKSNTGTFLIKVTNDVEAEPGGTYHDITIDGELVASVAEGNTYTLPTDAQYGYYDGSVLYHGGESFTVDADMSYTAVDEFEVTILNAASIYLGDQAGIRFQATVNTNEEIIDADGIVAEGTLITPTDIYDENGDLTIDADYDMVDVQNSGWYNSKTGTYCGSIVGVSESNYARDFAARAYAVLTYADGDTEVVYSSVYSRSIASVAYAIEQSGTGSYSDAEWTKIHDYASYYII